MDNEFEEQDYMMYPYINEFVEHMDIPPSMMSDYDYDYEDDYNKLYIDPRDTIEGLWENRLEMSGPKSEIKRFIRENRTETSMLTLHAQNGTKEELPKMWVNPNNGNAFLADAFDVEWVEPLNTILFRIIFVIPDVWIKMKSMEYPRIGFTLIYGDNNDNISGIFQVKNGSVRRDERGDYCKYWQPYCENCDRQVAKIYNVDMYSYLCESCNILMDNKIIQTVPEDEYEEDVIEQ